MNLVGFNFNKISIEKIGEINKNLKINTSMDISSIEKIENTLLRNVEGLINVVFNYKVDYEPDFAKIEFKGSMILSLEENQVKTILKNWKDKKISEEIKIPLFNTILRKSSVKALQLEEEMNLPYHMPLPKFSNQQKEEKN